MEECAEIGKQVAYFGIIAEQPINSPFPIISYNPDLMHNKYIQIRNFIVRVFCIY
jgi:hypothetical protein